MNAENIVDAEPILTAPVPAPAKKKKSTLANPMVWLQAIVFIAGLALLFWFIYKTGYQKLYDSLSVVGWGFLIIVALNGARHFLRALCIYLAIPPQHRSFKFRYAIAARLGGEAISVITFTGPFLGDATKAALLKRNIPLSHGGAAVIVDNILYYTSVIIVVLAGVGLMALTNINSKTISWMLFGTAVFAVLIFVGMGLLVWYHIKPLSWVIRKLANRNWAPQFVLRKQKSVFELENNVYQFYLQRKGTFFALFGISFLAHILSVLEVYLALWMLNFPTGVSVAFIIESLTKVVNFSFSFVPGAVGVYEGGNDVILKALHYDPLMYPGVALALVRRGAIMFWTFVGLGILLWRTVLRSTHHLSKRAAESE
jgi:uncharacterized membrane protein YbhN (UPF0104 family)